MNKIHADLLIYLLAAPEHLLAAPLAEWLVNAPRFAEFANRYRDKIRKRSAPPRTMSACTIFWPSCALPGCCGATGGSSLNMSRCKRQKSAAPISWRAFASARLAISRGRGYGACPATGRSM
ncbi:hypothetical protein HC891_07615 [Candidatus Gracilibacteria bacterium]|nr:hypothetical protein [Candidatus Gracilibacteria bacterium]